MICKICKQETKFCCLCSFCNICIETYGHDKCMEMKLKEKEIIKYNEMFDKINKG